MSNWKYIEYSLYNSNDTYYNLRKMFSYNLPIMMIIGARGMGKSFSIKEFCINDYINDNARNFCWVRESDDALELLLGNNGRKFKEDIPIMKIKELQKLDIKGRSCAINGKIAGDFLSASLYQKYKGSSFQKAYNIVIDEFIPEKTTIKKISPIAIFNTISTIARTRSQGRIFMTANAIDRGDPFLDAIGVELKDFGLYINRESGVVLHYADNSAKFNQLNSQGIVGKLLLNCKNMYYADNMMFGKFMDDNTLIFESMPSKCKLLLILETPLQKARFYQGEGKLWVTPDVDPNTYWNKRYVANLEDASAFKPVLPLEIKKKLKLHLQNNKVRYQSNFLKKFIANTLK